MGLVKASGIETPTRDDLARLDNTGGMRRTHLRGHQNILKRLLSHVAAFNLGLVMRKALRAGTPRGFFARLLAAVLPKDALQGVLEVRKWLLAPRCGRRWMQARLTTATNHALVPPAA